MPDHSGMQHHLTGLEEILKLRAAASFHKRRRGNSDTNFALHWGGEMTREPVILDAVQKALGSNSLG